MTKPKKKYFIIILSLILLLIPSYGVNAAEKKKQSTVRIYNFKGSRNDADPKDNKVQVLISPKGKVTIDAKYNGATIKASDELKKAFNEGQAPSVIHVGQRSYCSDGSTIGQCSGNTLVTQYTLLTKSECSHYDKTENNSSYSCNSSLQFYYNKKATTKTAKDKGYKAGNLPEYTAINSCEEMLSVALLKLLKKYYSLVLWGTIIGLIMLGIMDVSKAVVSADEGEMKKSYVRFSKRAVIAVVIILLPTILSVLLTAIASGNDYGKECVDQFIYKK